MSHKLGRGLRTSTYIDDDPGGASPLRLKLLKARSYGRQIKVSIGEFVIDVQNLDRRTLKPKKSDGIRLTDSARTYEVDDHGELLRRKIRIAVTDRHERHMQAFRCPLLCMLTSAVVTGCCRDVCVTNKTLHDRDIDSSVQEI